MSAKPQFSPEAQARRARKAERAESFRDHVADAFDIGRGNTDQGGSSVLDGGSELALAAASRAVAAGRRLRPSEKREVRQQVLEQTGGQSAGHTQRRRPSPREWLEAMTPAQRRNIERTEYLNQQHAEVQARILRLRDEVEEIDAEGAERAEYEIARQQEEAWLAQSWESGDYWEGADDAFEERLANRLELDSAVVSTDWEDRFGDSDEEEVEE